MKRFFKTFFLCACLFTCGALLFSCGEAGDSVISFECNSSAMELVLTLDDEELSPNEEGNFVVAQKSNVRVQVFSLLYADDFSSVTLTVNDEARVFYVDADYDVEDSSGRVYAGYFLLPYVQEDLHVVIDGVSTASSTFSLVGEDLSTSNLSTLSLVEVCTSESGDDFVALSDFLKGSSSTYTRDLDAEKSTASAYRTLRFKFAEGIFEMDSIDNFLKVYDENGVQVSAATLTQNGDEYVAYLGDLSYQSEYYIRVDASQLEYVSYAFNMPLVEGEYVIWLSAYTHTYWEEVTITIEGEFSSATVYVDDEQISLSSVSISEGRRTCTYVVPAKTVPKNGVTHQIEVEIS